MRRASLAAALFLLAAAGCGERSEPTGDLAARYPVTVRGAGSGPAVLERVPARIVALDPGSAELVAALGASERLVGVPAGYAGDRADGAALVAERSGRVDITRAIAARPDLVVTTPRTAVFDARTAADEAGAALYVQADGGLAAVERAAIDLGFLLGRPVAARQLVADLRRDADAVSARVRRLRPARVFVDAGFLVTVPPDSLALDLLRRAGGVSVGREGAHPEPYDLCEVARLEPDVFLRLTEPGEPNPGRPRFGRCRGANRHVRYVELRADLVTRAGPRVAAGLAALARALHPDAF